MKDVLEQLADIEVRQPPPEFNRQLHARLNRVLTGQHLLDLVFGAVPCAAAHFLCALASFAAFSFTGKFDDERRPKEPEK